MLDGALNEQDWVPQEFAPERPHMETNRWLNAVLPTQSSRPRPLAESETLDVLGVKIIWTKDRNRPFPTPVLDVLKTLLDFTELPNGWSSYGGRPLQAAAVPSVIKFVIRGYQLAEVPRLHPLPDGGVGLSWNNREQELDIMVAGDGTVEGLLSVSEDEEVEVLPGSPLGEGLDLLERYLATR